MANPQQQPTAAPQQAQPPEWVGAWESVQQTPEFAKADDMEREGMRLDVFRNYVAPQLRSYEMDEGLKRFNQYTAPQGDPTSGIGGDTVAAVKSGLWNVGGDIASAFTLGDPNAVSLDMKARSEEAWNQASPSAIQETAAFGIDYEEGEGVSGLSFKPGSTGYGAYLNAVKGGVSMVPMFAVGGMAGLAAKGISRVAGVTKATKAAVAAKNMEAAHAAMKQADTIRKVTQFGTQSALMGGMIGGSTSDQAINEVYNQPEAVLNQSEIYRGYLDGGMNKAQARDTIARDAAKAAFGGGFTLGAISGGFYGMFLDKMLKGGLGATTRLGNVGRGALGETFQETVESGGQQYLSNVAQGDVGLNVDPMKNVIGQAATGALLGGLMGGPIGGLSRGQAAPNIDHITGELKAAQINRNALETELSGELDEETRTQKESELQKVYRSILDMKAVHKDLTKKGQKATPETKKTPPPAGAKAATGTTEPATTADTEPDVSEANWVDSNIDEQIRDLIKDIRQAESNLTRTAQHGGDIDDNRILQRDINEKKAMLERMEYMSANIDKQNYFDNKESFYGWVEASLGNDNERVSASQELKQRQGTQALGGDFVNNLEPELRLGMQEQLAREITSEIPVRDQLRRDTQEVKAEGLANRARPDARKKLDQRATEKRRQQFEDLKNPIEVGGRFEGKGQSVVIDEITTDPDTGLEMVSYRNEATGKSEVTRRDFFQNQFKTAPQAKNEQPKTPEKPPVAQAVPAQKPRPEPVATEEAQQAPAKTDGGAVPGTGRPGVFESTPERQRARLKNLRERLEATGTPQNKQAATLIRSASAAMATHGNNTVTIAGHTLTVRNGNVNKAEFDQFTKAMAKRAPRSRAQQVTTVTNAAARTIKTIRDRFANLDDDKSQKLFKLANHVIFVLEKRGVMTQKYGDGKVLRIAAGGKVSAKDLRAFRQWLESDGNTTAGYWQNTVQELYDTLKTGPRNPQTIAAEILIKALKKKESRQIGYDYPATRHVRLTNGQPDASDIRSFVTWLKRTPALAKKEPATPARTQARGSLAEQYTKAQAEKERKLRKAEASRKQYADYFHRRARKAMANNNQAIITIGALTDSHQEFAASNPDSKTRAIKGKAAINAMKEADTKTIFYGVPSKQLKIRTGKARTGALDDFIKYLSQPTEVEPEPAPTPTPKITTKPVQEPKAEPVVEAVPKPKKQAVINKITARRMLQWQDNNRLEGLLTDYGVDRDVDVEHNGKTINPSTMTKKEREKLSGKLLDANEKLNAQVSDYGREHFSNDEDWGDAVDAAGLEPDFWIWQELDEKVGPKEPYVEVYNPDARYAVGDTVTITSGKYKGKTGTVTSLPRGLSDVYKLDIPDVDKTSFAESNLETASKPVEKGEVEAEPVTEPVTGITPDTIKAGDPIPVIGKGSYTTEFFAPWDNENGKLTITANSDHIAITIKAQDRFLSEFIIPRDEFFANYNNEAFIDNIVSGQFSPDFLPENAQYDSDYNFARQNFYKSLFNFSRMFGNGKAPLSSKQISNRVNKWMADNNQQSVSDLNSQSTRKLLDDISNGDMSLLSEFEYYLSNKDARAEFPAMDSRIDASRNQNSYIATRSDSGKWKLNGLPAMDTSIPREKERPVKEKTPKPAAPKPKPEEHREPAKVTVVKMQNENGKGLYKLENMGYFQDRFFDLDKLGTTEDRFIPQTVAEYKKKSSDSEFLVVDWSIPGAVSVWVRSKNSITPPRGWKDDNQVIRDFAEGIGLVTKGKTPKALTREIEVFLNAQKDRKEAGATPDVSTKPEKVSTLEERVEESSETVPVAEPPPTASENHVDEFLATMTPMAKGKASKVLAKLMRFNGGAIKPRNQHIEDAIADGAIVETMEVADEKLKKKMKERYDYLLRHAPRGNKNHPDTIEFHDLREKLKRDVIWNTIPVLKSQDGSYFTAEEITKTGMDYADYLQNRKPSNNDQITQAAPEQAPVTEPVSEPVAEAKEKAFGEYDYDKIANAITEGNRDQVPAEYMERYTSEWEERTNALVDIDEKFIQESDKADKKLRKHFGIPSDALNSGENLWSKLRSWKAWDRAPFKEGNVKLPNGIRVYEKTPLTIYGAIHQTTAGQMQTRANKSGQSVVMLEVMNGSVPDFWVTVTSPVSLNTPQDKIHFESFIRTPWGNIRWVDKADPETSETTTESFADNDGEANAEALRSDDHYKNIAYAYRRMVNRGPVSVTEIRAINKYFSGDMGMQALKATAEANKGIAIADLIPIIIDTATNPEHDMHVTDSGKIEEIDGEVIRDALEDAEATPRFEDITDARKWLVKQIERAIRAAPEEAASKDFIRFTVPGDGTFRVINNKERLSFFKKQVENSGGFKKPVNPRSLKPKPASSFLAAMKDFIKDGEYINAYWYAKNHGKSLLYSRDHTNTGMSAYLPVDEITIHGKKFIIGEDHNGGLDIIYPEQSRFIYSAKNQKELKGQIDLYKAIDKKRFLDKLEELSADGMTQKQAEDQFKRDHKIDEYEEAGAAPVTTTASEPVVSFNTDTGTLERNGKPIRKTKKSALQTIIKEAIARGELPGKQKDYRIDVPEGAKLWQATYQPPVAKTEPIRAGAQNGQDFNSLETDLARVLKPVAAIMREKPHAIGGFHGYDSAASLAQDVLYNLSIKDIESKIKSLGSIENAGMYQSAYNALLNIRRKIGRNDYSESSVRWDQLLPAVPTQETTAEPTAQQQRKQKRKRRMVEIDAELDELGAEMAAIFKEAGSGLGFGLDPTIAGKLMIVGVKAGVKIAEKGAIKFADWADSMLGLFERHGVSDRDAAPYLKRLYLATQAEVSDDLVDQMDDRKEVRNFDLDTLLDEDVETTAEPARNAWELPIEQWVDQEIRNGDYADEYLSDPEAYEGKAKQLRKDWKEHLEEQAIQGRLPTVAIDSFVDTFGMPALQSIFRGVHEKGIEGYQPKDIRTWDKTYQQALKMKRDGKLGVAGNMNVRDFHRNDIRKAIANGETIPDNVLSEYPELAGEANVQHSDRDLERDSGVSEPETPVGATSLQDESGTTGSTDGRTGQTDETGGIRDTGNTGVSDSGTTTGGTDSHTELLGTKGGFESESGTASSGERGGSSNTGQQGIQPDARADQQVENATDATGKLTLEQKVDLQEKAESIPSKTADLQNIRDTLPVLLPEQQDDVLKSEKRLFTEGKPGMLFTNGTGTGKTFTGLGQIKRFAREGKDNILIMAPSDTVAESWIASGLLLGLDITQLKNTKDAGKGIVITTYANAGDNDALVTRDWDLVVADESHKLMAGSKGDSTQALQALRAITLNKHGIQRRYGMQNRDDINLLDELDTSIENLLTMARLGDVTYEQAAQYRDQAREKQTERDTLRKKLQAKLNAVRAQITGTAEKDRPKSLFLSATPFAYHFSLDYADGYLFDQSNGQEENTSRGYNEPDHRDRFYIQNFGYRMRYNKLTAPDADVDVGLMEREFNQRMKDSGALSGRKLEVDADYSREFILIDDAIGRKIDEGVELIRSDERLKPLYPLLEDQFKYLEQMMMLEAIKAKHAVERIKEHQKLGRKVVVFHNFKVGGTQNPFIFHKSHMNSKEANDAIGLFNDLRPDLANMELDLPSPIVTLSEAFPDLLLFNGSVKPRDRKSNVNIFNNENNANKVILIQREAGKEGISLQDVTGKYQRAMIDLGLPGKPSDLIQSEGRTYRVGQKSDAVLEYFNTGTSYEKMAFASRIATRASTAENLALGHEGRQLLPALVEALKDSNSNLPSLNQGKGGKEGDRQQNTASAFDRAKTYYFGRQKRTSKNKSAEGTDYFATPEPIGLKMTEMTGIKRGESMLEPSAGHGAVGRFFPEFTRNTFIEPSYKLSADLSLSTQGKILNQTFEDFSLINKFDGIAMNPPFGVGGKTAAEHVEKAMKHTRDGGRIVALIPAGPAADKRFAALEDSDTAKHFYKVAEILLPASMFERAGTKVMSKIVVWEKQEGENNPSKLQMKNRDFRDAKNIKELFDLIEDFTLPDRLPPEPKPVKAAELIDGELTLTKSGKTTIFSTMDTKHTKTNADLFVVNMEGSLDDAQYQSVSGLAKENGGFYINARGRHFYKPPFGTTLKGKPTFTFRNVEDRNDFLAAVQEQAAPETVTTPEPTAKPVPPKASNVIEGYSDKHPDWAVDLAKDKAGGRVTYSDADYALIEAYGVSTGEPYYHVAFRAGQTYLGQTTATMSQVDITHFTGELDPDARKRLEAARQKYIDNEKALYERNPDGPFANSDQQVVGGDGISESVLNVAKSWLTMMGIKDRVFISSTLSDTEASTKKYNLYGPFAPIRRVSDPNSAENGSQQTLANGVQFISVKTGLSEDQLLATLAHEIGHVAEKAAFKNASQETQNAVRDAHLQWIKEHQPNIQVPGSARKLIESMRHPSSSEVVGITETTQANDLNLNYWSSFSEWFADNTARWAMTSKKPKSAVEKFFKSVAEQLRKLYAALSGRKYLPNKALADYLDALTPPDFTVEDAIRQANSPYQQAKSRAPANSPSKIRQQVNILDKATQTAMKKVAMDSKTTSKEFLRNNTLGFFGGKQLAEMYKHLFSHLQKTIGHNPLERLDKLLQNMIGGRAIWANAAEKLDQRWAKLARNYPNAYNLLSDLMHKSTLHQLDPRQAFKTQSGRTIETLRKILENPKSEAQRHKFQNELDRELQRQSRHKELKGSWDALATTTDAQDLFNAVEKYYKEQWEATQQALLDKVEGTQLDPDAKKAARAEIELMFSQALDGPYFPLMRFGDYVITGKQPDGQRFRMQYETKTAMDTAELSLIDQGYDIDFTGMRDKFNPSGMEGVGQFSAKVNKILATNLDTTGGEYQSIMDEINQITLDLMPEISAAKRLKHRKGIPGYHENARRAFEASSLTNANRIVRIKYSWQMEAELERMKNVANEKIATSPLTGSDRIKAKQVYNEMQARHDEIMNPRGNRISANLTNFGFFMYLGGSIGAGIVNMTQNLLIALPQMGAKYGFRKTAKIMGQVTKDYFTRGGKMPTDLDGLLQNSWFSLENATGLPADEIALIKRLIEDGTIETSQSHVLMQLADMDIKPEHIRRKDWVTRANRATGVFFHNAEVANRQIAALTAYRLAKANPKHGKVVIKDGNPDEATVDRIRKAVFDAHYDYSSTNRPRYFRSNWAKVFLLFKQYSQNTLFFLGRNMQQSLKGESLKVRKQARATLGMTFAMHGIFAGVMGLPTAGVWMALAGLFIGDEDDPVDPEVAMRNTLAEWTNPKIAHAMSKGLINALTGFDFHSRTGASDLLYRSSDYAYTAREKMQHFLVNALGGPLAGLSINMASSLDKFAQGNTAQGIESLMPKFIRDGIRSVNFATGGMKDYKGRTIIDEFTVPELVGQFIGIAPAKVSEVRDYNRSIKGYEQAVRYRRSQLMDEYFRLKTTEDRQRKWQEIQAFSEVQKSRGNDWAEINRKDLTASGKSREKYTSQSEHGVSIPQARLGLRSLGAFADI